MLIAVGEPVEVVYDLVGQTRDSRVSPNCPQEVCCPTIVQEEYALTDTPERRRAKFLSVCATLRNAVRQPRTHVVDQQVGE